MCGRFTLSQTAAAISQIFHIEKIPEQEPQYNIAPTQMVMAVFHNPKTQQRELQKLRWGLIPHWAKDLGLGAKLINARSETVAEKPAFRSAFQRQRCLIVADGFYEWQHKEGTKQPFYFRLQEGKLFGFAGLWEQWRSPEESVLRLETQHSPQSPAPEEITSCTILTTQANELLQPIHERMPVILSRTGLRFVVRSTSANT